MRNLHLGSRVFALIARLPPARTYDVVVDRDLQVPMPDGVVLLADHYYPRSAGKLPTILVRSPYGRSAPQIAFMSPTLFAERGFQVLFQSVRGTFGSGGQFNPFQHERADGLATIEWIKKQEWFSGVLAMHGPSYLGYVQWAVAAQAGPELKAISAQVTFASPRTAVYQGESFALENALDVVYLFSMQERSHLRAWLALFGRDARLEAALSHLPLNEADRVAVGRLVQYWQDYLEHNEPDDPWWEPIDHSASVPEVTVPVNLLGGWYDLLLPDTIGQYEALRRAGREPRLVIGPWIHLQPQGLATGTRESLAWFRTHLLGEPAPLPGGPVRLFVTGAGEWRDYPTWPPPGYGPQCWHLQPGRGLAPEAPVASDPDRYSYNPADPTPSVGGALLRTNAGPKDQRTREARPDVLTYTSASLDRDVEAIGPVRAELYVRSSLEHTDFFVSVCDVDPRGKSINVCDGLLRLRPGRPATEPDGTRRVSIDLYPTAHRFRRGHRIRVQVSSGAHPRFARNPGSGELLATTTTLLAANQEVFHDPAHPSAIVLPVRV